MRKANLCLLKSSAFVSDNRATEFIGWRLGELLCLQNYLYKKNRINKDRDANTTKTRASEPTIALESRNGKSKKAFQQHPNIYRFIEVLNNEQTNEKQHIKYAKINKKLERVKKGLLRANETTPFDDCEN